MRPGGVFSDTPSDFWPALSRFMNDFRDELSDLEDLLMENEILLARTKGVSPLSPDIAVNCSVSGPVLRASGISWDWRKKAPYDAYSLVDFAIPTGSNWDN